MPSLTSLNVSLTPELESFIKTRVATGQYATSSEVVREGLRLLQQRERESDESLAALKEKLQRSIDQADRGELIDGDVVFEKARALIEKRRQEQLERKTS